MATSATGRMTLGAVFGTIATTAGAISGLVGTAAAAVQLADNYVDAALSEQRKRQALDAAALDQRLVEELSQEAAQRAIALDSFCDQSAKHKEHFDANYAKFAAVLANLNGNKAKSASTQT